MTLMIYKIFFSYQHNKKSQWWPCRMVSFMMGLSSNSFLGVSSYCEMISPPKMTGYVILKLLTLVLNNLNEKKNLGCLNFVLLNLLVHMKIALWWKCRYAMAQDTEFRLQLWYMAATAAEHLQPKRTPLIPFWNSDMNKCHIGHKCCYPRGPQPLGCTWNFHLASMAHSHGSSAIKRIKGLDPAVLTRMI